MNSNDKSTLQKMQLRAKAESNIKNSKDLISDLTSAQVQELIHELKVHQFELEHQNQNLAQALSELEYIKEEYADLYDNAPVGYLTANAFGEITKANQTLGTMLKTPVEKLLRTNLSPWCCEEYAYYLHCRNLMQKGGSLETKMQMKRTDNSIMHVSVSSRLVGQSINNTHEIRSIIMDITEEKTLKQMAQEQSALLKISRAAGMAEVACDVLHNVGNALNNANTSCSVIMDMCQQSRIGNLEKIAGLLSTHQDHLSSFLSNDPRGCNIPNYLRMLGGVLQEEHKAIQQETLTLQYHIEHISRIVTRQQSLGRISGVSETVTAEQLLEEALMLYTGDLIRHNISVLRYYEDLPPLTVNKNAVLQILVNLIENADYACKKSNNSDKRITFKTKKQSPDRICLEVEDNGIGISKENLMQIFQHGFTTRKNQTGSGLHTAALTAKRLGGHLAANSPGPGFGATFTLELPLHPPIK